LLIIRKFDGILNPEFWRLAGLIWPRGGPSFLNFTFLDGDRPSVNGAGRYNRQRIRQPNFLNEGDLLKRNSINIGFGSEVITSIPSAPDTNLFYMINDYGLKLQIVHSLVLKFEFYISCITIRLFLS
jgi:hypothetical protein